MFASAKPSDDKINASFCNDAFVHFIGRAPGPAMEAGGQCAWRLSTLNLSAIPYYAEAGVWRSILELAAPDARRCGCALEHWREYAMCSSSLALASRAVSFGVRGYDDFGHHVQKRSALVPELYDCFDPRPVSEFPNHLFPVCLGGEVFTDGNGRRFETLPRLLQNAANLSVLVKMDIEAAEQEVLQHLADEDFRKIRSLSVEFHPYLFESATTLLSLLKLLQPHFVVVEAYYELHRFEWHPRERHYLPSLVFPAMFANAHFALGVLTTWSGQTLARTAPTEYFPPAVLFVNFMSRAAPECTQTGN